MTNLCILKKLSKVLFSVKVYVLVSRVMALAHIEKVLALNLSAGCAFCGICVEFACSRLVCMGFCCVLVLKSLNTFLLGKFVILNFTKGVILSMNKISLFQPCDKMFTCSGCTEPSKAGHTLCDYILP